MYAHTEIKVIPNRNEAYKQISLDSRQNSSLF